MFRESVIVVVKSWGGGPPPSNLRFPYFHSVLSTPPPAASMPRGSFVSSIAPSPSYLSSRYYRTDWRAAPRCMPPQPLVTASLANSPTASPPPVQSRRIPTPGCQSPAPPPRRPPRIEALPTAANRREGGGEYRERGHHRELRRRPRRGKIFEEREIDRGGRWRRRRRRRGPT